MVTRTTRRWLWLTLLGVVPLYLTLLLTRQEAAIRDPFLFMVVAVVSALLGLPQGLAATAGALALEVLGGEWDWRLAWLGGALLLSALLASRLSLDLRRSHAEQRRTARALSLLVSAFSQLSGLERRSQVLEALPELLGRHREGHVSVWVPRVDELELASACGFDAQERRTLAASGVVGRALRDGKPVYIDDVSADPAYIALPGQKGGSELALPLDEQGETVAVLNLERPGPFALSERTGFGHFARGVSQVLTSLAARREAETQAELVRAMGSATSLAEVCDRGLALLLEELDCPGGVLVGYSGGRFRAMSVQGRVPEAQTAVLEEGLPLGRGSIWEAYRSGEPLFIGDYVRHPRAEAAFVAAGVGAVAFFPLSGTPFSRLILVLQDYHPRRWGRREARLLVTSGRLLKLMVDEFELRDSSEEMMRLEREVLEHLPEEMYRRLLAAAVRLVPGAEAGSLLVRRGESDEFCYQATLGYDLEALADIGYSEADMRTWYGLDPAAWSAAEPRILSSLDTAIEEVSSRTAPPATMRDVGRVGDIRANLCLPVRFRGKVLAVLNLDALNDPQAFTADSVAAARRFLPLLEFVLHEARQRQMLEATARTDALTGLANRRAFDWALATLIARSNRYGYPLSLLIMDLQGFKQVNDRLGHARGDSALQAVAFTLQAGSRDGDQVFRWGGDEFAVLLPHTDRAGARVAAGRYAEAVAAIEVGGLKLGVNIGVATLPDDGTHGERLLHLADGRMYAAKAEGRSVAEDVN